MPFEQLLTDTVSLMKQDGSKVEAIKASVQTNKIYIQRTDVLIEPGDLLLRHMSNGGEETFEVLDPGFHEKFHGIPAGYQLKVRKLGVPEAKSAMQTITYNITGNNARINQNSTDQSVNVVQTPPDITTKLEELRKEITRCVETPEEEREALDVVSEIEEQFGSGAPKKSVVKALIASLPAAGNIASIGSFLLSYLD